MQRERVKFKAVYKYLLAPFTISSKSGKVKPPVVCKKKVISCQTTQAALAPQVPLLPPLRGEGRERAVLYWKEGFEKIDWTLPLKSVQGILGFTLVPFSCSLIRWAEWHCLPESSSSHRRNSSDTFTDVYRVPCMPFLLFGQERGCQIWPRECMQASKQGQR